MTDINLEAVVAELRKSVADAQDRAHRHDIAGDSIRAARAEETAELLRALVRAVNAGRTA